MIAKFQGGMMNKLDDEIENLILCLRTVEERDHATATRMIDIFYAKTMSKLKYRVPAGPRLGSYRTVESRQRLRCFRRSLGQHEAKRKALEAVMDAYEVKVSINELESSGLALARSVRTMCFEHYDPELADDYDFQRDIVELFLDGEKASELVRRFHVISVNDVLFDRCRDEIEERLVELAGW